MPTPTRFRRGVFAGASTAQGAGGRAAGILPAALLAGWFVVCLGCRTGGPLFEPSEYRPTSHRVPQINPDLLRPFQPSNERDWSPDQAVLSTAEFHDSRVTVRNIRHMTYRSLDDYDVAHYDKTFDLNHLDRVDFIVVPFNDIPSVAHTMLSFGFAGRDYLGVSVEIRKKRGDSYNPVKGVLRQYEIMYVIADERDLILRRVMHDMAGVYVYRLRMTPEQQRALLVDVLRRANKLTVAPEFYDTLTNNCTTNIRDHINRTIPGAIPPDYRILLPGLSDQLAYERGLLDTDSTFARTKADARVNYLAYLHRDDPEFSVKIRQ